MEDINEILNLFIKQSKTDNLKTKDYPREFLDLNMKVSFGQGVPARVSWVSLLAPEMQTSKGFYPVYLFYKKENKLILAYGISETSEFSSKWPEEIYTKTKISDYLQNPPRYGDSFVFKSYIPSISNDVSYSNDDNQAVSKNMLKNDLEEIANYYKKAVSLEVKDKKSSTNQSLFYMEKQLEDFIIENWDKTKFGKKYDLIIEDGQIVSQQYRTSIGPIDILAKDKRTGNYVVIELKKNQTSDDTLGQILRYMGWIKKHKKDDNVKGIIVAGQRDKKLEYALLMVPFVEVLLYNVDFTLEEY